MWRIQLTSFKLQSSLIYYIDYILLNCTRSYIIVRFMKAIRDILFWRFTRLPYSEVLQVEIQVRSISSIASASL